MSQKTWENAENLVLSPILAQIWLLLLDVRHSCKLSLYAVSTETNKLADLAQIRAAICFCFQKIWLCQSLDIIVSYHHV